MNPTQTTEFVTDLQTWGAALGFAQIGISDVDLTHAEPAHFDWLEKGFHGEMTYMASHGTKRTRPSELLPGTISIVTARMPYLPIGTPENWRYTELKRRTNPSEAVVSIYARGRDYHKVFRARLQKLALQMQQKLSELSPLNVALAHRVFVDSAPVLEAQLAEKSGQGWHGKHTLIVNKNEGSMFFLGEIYLNIHLPPTPNAIAHCGSCSACMVACPTQAIVASNVVDARRCISYLTIEASDAIPLAFRPLIGNKIYGCDDCQTVCPWNKFSHQYTSPLPDFQPRLGMTNQQLTDVMAWNESDFLRLTEGSAIRRIGFVKWQRNVAVALGNARRALSPLLVQNRLEIAKIDAILSHELNNPQTTPLVKEHIVWAMAQVQGH